MTGEYVDCCMKFMRVATWERKKVFSLLCLAARAEFAWLKVQFNHAKLNLLIGKYVKYYEWFCLENLMKILSHLIGWRLRLYLHEQSKIR